MYWKRKPVIAGLTLLLALSLFSGCTGSGEEPETPALAEESSTQGIMSSADYDESSATIITLEGTSAQIEGGGASASESLVTITEGGTYLLRGTFAGQVLVEAGKEDTVQLVLDGATINGTENAGIYGKRAGTLVVTLADGSDNGVSDAASYTYADEESEEPDAALFSKGDLTINGTGSLTVNAGFYNGIGSKDHLVVDSGTLRITAVNHGIRGRDSLTIRDGGFTIQAGNDGIQSNNSDEGKGWITIQGGSFDITAGHDAIQAESSLTIEGGSFTLSTAGGCEAEGLSADESYKGLKAGGDILITGGTFVIDSADDAVHSNADIEIRGGTFTISTGDDGVHADGHLEISGGEIDILRSYEGLEAFTMTISGGRIDLVASDDGINVAGGTDGTGGNGPFGDSFAQSGARWLHITGGHVTVDASGDGLDANGDIEISGGTVIVNGPVWGGDAPLDFDGSFSISGGTLVAAGSSGMAQVPGSGSTQASLALYFTSVQPGGTPVEVQDTDGGTVAQFTPTKDFQFIVFSGPNLEQGATYSLVVDGTSLVQVTLSDITTSISETGEAVSGFGGFGGGGMGGRETGGGPGGWGGTPPQRDGEMPQPGGGEMPPDGPGEGRGGPGGEMPEGGPPDRRGQ